MKPISSLVSAFTSIRDDFRNNDAKLDYLWYDRIILETLGNMEKDTIIKGIVKDQSLSLSERSNITDVFVTVRDVVGASALKEYRQQDLLENHRYPRWGDGYTEYTYPEPEDPFQEAHNAVLAHLERKHGIKKFTGIEVEHAEGAAGSAVSALRLWGFVNPQTECILHTDIEEKIALDAALRFGTTTSEKGSKRLLEALIPDLSRIEWPRLVKIRKSGEFDNLKQKINDIYVSASATDTDPLAAFEKVQAEAISEIVDSARPRPAKALFEAITSNIPMGMFNPFSIGFGAKSLVSEVNKSRNYGWLYMLKDMQREASQE